MGMAFPLGMMVASVQSEALTPWLWGLNGATSVLSSVVAFLIALGSGVTAAFWSGLVCYAVATASYFWLAVHSIPIARGCEALHGGPRQAPSARVELEQGR
jgi:hypothetical protein